MKKLLLLIALATTGPVLAKTCCKDKNPNCCDTHKTCPAGSTEPCDGACLPDKPKTEAAPQAAKHKTPRKHAKKHHTHHKHVKKHHETTVH